MLALRFTRAGRRNSAFFRIVLTEQRKSSKSGFIKVLGWYDPKTKKSSLDKEAVLDWIKLGAKPSNSLAKFLNEQKISHKNIVFVADAPKKPKTKEEKAAQSSSAGTKTTEADASASADARTGDKTTEKTETPAQEKTAADTQEAEVQNTPKENPQENKEETK